MTKKMLFFAPLAVLGMAVFALIGGEIVKWLWNWLMPSLFGLPSLTFWKALGVLALSRILFGGHNFGRANARHRTPEDRERFRQAIRKRFGFDTSTPPPPAA